MDWEKNISKGDIRHRPLKMQKELKLLDPMKTKNPTKDGQKRDIYRLPSPKAQRTLEKRSIKTRVRGQGSLRQNLSSGHVRAIAFMNVQPSCLSKTYTDEPSQYFNMGGTDPSLR